MGGQKILITLLSAINVNHYYIATFRQRAEYGTLFRFPDGITLLESNAGVCFGINGDSYIFHDMTGGNIGPRVKYFMEFVSSLAHTAVIHYKAQICADYSGKGGRTRYYIRIIDPHNILNLAGHKTPINPEMSQDRRVSIHYGVIVP